MAIVYGHATLTGTCGGCGAPNTATVQVSGDPLDPRDRGGLVAVIGNCGGCGTEMSFRGYAQVDGGEDTREPGTEFDTRALDLGESGYADTCGDDHDYDLYDHGHSSRARVVLAGLVLVVLVLVVITHISQLRP